MEQVIINKIRDIEAFYDVSILYACEAGSRAFGLATKASDYDVRFIYVHKIETYLNIDHLGTSKRRDVIEMPIKGKIDMNGWELTKALRLFRKSNPNLLEWLHAKTIYYEVFSTISKMRKLLPEILHPKTCILHYVNMAKTNMLKLNRNDQSDLKLYLNCIRPILAAIWLQTKMSFPPNNLNILVETIIPELQLKNALKEIIAIKRTSQHNLRPIVIEQIAEFIAKEIDQLYAYGKTIDNQLPDCTDTLNHLFRSTLTEVWQQ